MKFIIAGLVLLILCGGVAVGGYFYYQSTQDEEESSDNTNDSDEEDDDSDDDDNAVTGTLKDILGQGKDYQCTWKASDTSSGTLYTDGEKYSIEASEAGQEFRIVYDGESVMYFWDDVSKTGFKYTLTQEEADDVNEDLGAPIDYDADYDYDCDSKNVDNSKFNVPSDVEFMDYSDLGNFGQ